MCVCVCVVALSMCLVCLEASLRTQEESGPVSSSYGCTSKECRGSLDLLIKNILNTHSLFHFQIIRRIVKYNPHFFICETVYGNIYLRDITRITYTEHV